MTINRKYQTKKFFFLRELVGDENVLKAYDEHTVILLKEVVKRIRIDTPYISFFSIFTVLSKDINGFGLDTNQLYSDYIKLWSDFQKWYYRSHNIVFQRSNLDDEVNRLFYRSIHSGHISNNSLKNELERTIKDCKKYYSIVPGYQNRYYVVVIKKVPTAENLKKISTLFRGRIYQNKWRIIHSSDEKKYRDYEEYFDFYPFMISC